MTVQTHAAGGTDQHPADVAQQETGRVASEAAAQARNLAGNLRAQVQDQAEQQRTRAAASLRSLGDGLDDMASGGGPGPAQDLVREVANRARGLSDFVDARNADELLDELRSLARRRPLVFLAGAAVAGAVFGRVSRGVLSAATGGQSPREALARSGDTPSVRSAGPAYVDTGLPATPTGATEPAYGGQPAYGTTGAYGATAEPAYGDVPPVSGSTGAGVGTLGPLGTTTGREEPPRASGTEGSFHG